jgi:hypothetical protein
MKFRLVFILVAAACLGPSFTGFAQATGSTTLDIDGVSGMVVATCETDLDATAQAYYHAVVECKVKDGDGKEIVSGQFTDKNGTQGYAQVVLTFMGAPGTNYTATASHYLEVILQTRAESLPELLVKPIDYDPFSFGDLGKLNETYQGMFEWFGAGTSIKK